MLLIWIYMVKFEHPIKSTVARHTVFSLNYHNKSSDSLTIYKVVLGSPLWMPNAEKSAAVISGRLHLS